MTDLVGSSRDVTVLGLGAMGSALAAALLATNREVTVWNRGAGHGSEGFVRLVETMRTSTGAAA